MGFLDKIKVTSELGKYTTIFGVFSRSYHSFECAFTTREDAEKYIKEQGGWGKYNIVPAQLYDSYEIAEQRLV